MQDFERDERERHSRLRGTGKPKHGERTLQAMLRLYVVRYVCVCTHSRTHVSTHIHAWGRVVGNRKYNAQKLGWTSTEEEHEEGSIKN